MMAMDATHTNPRKFAALLSYRVATRRYCFRRAKYRSTTFRSRYRCRPYAIGCLRFFRGGMHGCDPAATMATRFASES